jgi:hypothetical protein
MSVRQIMGDSGCDGGTSGVIAGSKTAAEVSAQNTEITLLLGLAGNVVTNFVIKPTVNTDGATATPNTAGLVVAAFSGLDAIYGADGALDLLATSTSLEDLVIDGGAKAGVLAQLVVEVPMLAAAAVRAISTAAQNDNATSTTPTLRQ